MLTTEELTRHSRRDLHALLQSGHAIDARALDDSEYLGTSLGLPRLIEALTWKTFMKTFHRDGDALRGWNVRLEQRGPGVAVPQRRCGERVTFGHYRVVPAESGRVPQGCARGLLLRYGRGRFDPLGRVRDPLVALERGSVELLLGWSYLDLAGRALGTPSYFCLERLGPLSHVAQ